MKGRLRDQKQTNLFVPDVIQITDHRERGFLALEALTWNRYLPGKLGIDNLGMSF